MRKSGKRKVKIVRYILLGIIVFLAIYLIVQAIRCKNALDKQKNRLESYLPSVMELSYGGISYVDKGAGDVILSVHGIFGGYDQGFDTCKDFVEDHRILAPSRFGYLGSSVLGKGTPVEQATAYTELLDNLGIDKVFVLSTSAGGSVAIRFALDYPERTKGLILYCSGMPPVEKPEKCPEYAGPPAFMCNDYAMFALSPLFKPLMGMEPATIYSMLPISERKEGVILDSSVTNLDMARNYDDYNIESMQVPVLVLHSKDDKLASYKEASQAVSRFPNVKFISFETGGHLMTGNEEAVKKAVNEFIEANK